MNAGKLLFAQLMDFLPWTSFARSVARYGGDRRVRNLSCTEQFRAMAFAQLTYRESLRDIEACLCAQPAKLYAMGFRSPVRRSTLAEANESRDWRIYAELAQRLMVQARKLYATEDLGMDLDAAAYALDSTTIDLCLTLFPWAHFRSTKSAVKMHTLLDLRGNIPTFIRVTTGDLHDVNMLDEIIPQAGAYYVMDRGYLDYARLYRLHLAGAFFVTRAKNNLDARRIYSQQVDKQTGILADQSIALNGYHSRKDYPSHLRRIRFHDPETGKDLLFLTNQFTLPAVTICALYKSRWQVELFFKWIKQHLRIKVFFGTSENAVKTQIWIAVSVYLLVAIVKKRLELSGSLYTLLQVLSVTLFEKMPISQALQQKDYTNSLTADPNQLILFDF
ncbi:IS4 family transposase [Telmatobacter bradus]|uniref:IS4 family transposase n=1 Tax=Telmatobacter bradus TaxID=474953 RepID=UPI003B43BB9E